MKTLFNRVNMLPGPAPRPLVPDRRRMSSIQNTEMSNNGMSLLSLRNKQIKESIDTVSFTGLTNR